MWDWLGAALTSALGSMLLFAPYVPFDHELRFAHPRVAQTPQAAAGSEVPSVECSRSGPGSPEGTFCMFPELPLDYFTPVMRFQVRDVPRPQGSKVSFVNPRTGRAVTKEDGKERLDRWRNAVQAAVLQHRDRPRTPIGNPVLLRVVFTFERPKSAAKGREVFPVTRSTGDLDKLERALFDSLTLGGVIKDDSLVFDVHARSVYTGSAFGALPWPGADIVLWELTEPIPLS